jgi:excisionase family DNA binding protein
MSATMTLDELCITLGRSRKTVVKALREGKVPGEQWWPGGPWVIPREAVERYLRGDWAPTRQAAPTPLVRRRAS